VAGTLVAALLIGGGAGYLGGHLGSNGGNGNVTSVNTPVADPNLKSATPAVASNLSKVVQAKLASIVTVSASGSKDSGTGSGVVINSRGDIVTNAHVVTVGGMVNNAALSIETSTGKTFQAKLIGYDATADVAVIRPTSATGLPPITFADSSALRVGDNAIAIGSPLGLSETVTSGIISALNRPITVQSAEVGSTSGQSVSLSAIQTDAAINEGNSGGALLDANGNLIGLNDAIATSDTSSGSIGIGFAIPANYVKRIALEIINTGHGSHALLGASLTSYSSDENSNFTSGATIRSLSAGGPAAKAGLQQGDVIVEADQTVISSATQLTAIIKAERPGDQVKVSYLRGGQLRNVNVKLGTAN
jgi:putative serine protease PepD